MEFIKKIEKNTYILYIIVKTNSKRQQIINDKNFLTIHIKSKPVKNKANKELVALLKHKLKIASNMIKIISGERSNNKVIQIVLLREEGEKELISRLFD